jgi:hypothetical protein
MTTHIYADGLSRVEAMNDIVKLDFVSFLPGSLENDGTYVTEPCLRLVMQPEALATLHAAMVNLVDKMERAGIVTSSGKVPET